MTNFNLISSLIIKEQELIIGPVAWSLAGKVDGLSIVNEKSGEVTVQGDGKQVVDNLVSRYVGLFGITSKEVCREAVGSLLVDMPDAEVPNSLK